MGKSVYKEIEELKTKIIEENNRITEIANKEFEEKEIEILGKIDTYLGYVAKELKDTNKDQWVFYSDVATPYNGKDYPSSLMVTFKNGNYELKTKLYSQFSGQQTYTTKIQDGILYMPMADAYAHILKDYPKYARTIIANWKKLKDAIIKGVVFDFDKVQKEISAKLIDIEKKKNLYDNFEL